MDCLRASVLRMSCVLLLGLVIGRAGATSKYAGCGQKEFIPAEILSCKADFIKSMNKSVFGLKDCPSLYEDAKTCVEEKVIKGCEDQFSPDDNSTKKVWEDLGTQQYFCTFGLLNSMRDAFKNVVECRDPNYKNYSVCEDKFHAAFRRQFAENSNKTEDMATLYHDARTCQHLTAESCGFTETNTEFLKDQFFNPYDVKAVERLSKATKIIESEGVPSSANSTYITVAVVVIGLVVGLCLIAFLLWRRDQTRAERRRKKAEDKKRAVGGQAPAEGTEMQPLAGQAVVTTTDEVAPAQEC